MVVIVVAVFVVVVVLLVVVVFVVVVVVVVVLFVEVGSFTVISSHRPCFGILHLPGLGKKLQVRPGFRKSHYLPTMFLSNRKNTLYAGETYSTSFGDETSR